MAPMLEREEDVAVRRRQDGAAYLVTPSELVGRARAVVSRAYEEEASLILMPEMVLTPRALAAFRQELLDRHSEHSERTNRLPPLSYALVGVVEEVEDGAARRNYVVVLDGTGEVLASQDKLSRWNLRPDEQQQYELAPVDAAVPDLLLEPISPAEEVVVVDLPGLGRLVVLICADMDVSEPGDWLYANAGLEWVYAPIMDRTRRPVRARGRVGPWIVRRAHRAACATRGRVIVTNSMALTPVVNRSNERRGLSADYPPSVECDVGLLIDGRDQEVTCEPVVVALGTADVAEVRDWNVGWQTFLE
ncbi:nitrilase-related carbon-nitrogen hydrolase [Sphingomonas corticis]|uniref:CN hydrolase domain-containing protein n=1 Tax=Sphingomonas corticis TaxID=2722791 RepID=A0ABX1CXB3_9SPHN|nr:nitrilase-related carbon-nitrogen hydrolase [Sphingomonas corticis]NJR80612.1 hypothetical protein [Sphingomonas corticis]